MYSLTRFFSPLIEIINYRIDIDIDLMIPVLSDYLMLLFKVLFCKGFLSSRFIFVLNFS